MKKHHIRLGCILISVLICMIPLLMLNVSGEEYDTRCNICCHDNPQWLNEDCVHYCGECGALGMPAIISDKKGSGTTTPDEPDNNDPSPYDTGADEDIPFEVVIGGAAVVTVIAVSIAKKKKKPGATTPRAKTRQPSNQRERSKEDQPAGYILQLSKDKVVLADGEDAVVGIRVMRVAGDGQTTVASNAQISLQMQKDSHLLVLPARGTGVLNVRIKQNSAVKQDIQESIQVTATVPEKTTVATITVMLNTGWKMVFR